MNHFESFLAPQLSQYITYRESLGYAKWPLISNLKTFDHYLKAQKIDRQQLQPSFFLELRAHLTLESRSVNRILSSTRVFFRYLVRKGYYTENPLEDIPLLPENAIIPFVFSPDETDQLLFVICKRLRKTPEYFLKDLSVALAIVLLARCGMRISEPLRLLIDHYRSREKTLYIEKTKFKKDRLIPVPESAARQIDNYLALRNTLLGEDPNPYLLAGKKQKGLKDDQIRRTFHQAVKDIGLDRPRQVIGHTNFSSPTPHSLRHSFAVNTLKGVKEREKSPQNALPILATYMGHSEYKHTVKYLKVADARQRQDLVDFAASQQKKR